LSRTFFVASRIGLLMRRSWSASLPAVLFAAGVTVTAQSSVPTVPRSGDDIYRAACVSCHGPDGRGAPRSAVGFDTPLPDFTDCRFSSPEPDADWMATIHDGGPARAFSRRMPAFGDALTEGEIRLVIGRLREFCREPRWPLGDLNLPRPLVTEKAFPENEALLTTSIERGTDGSVVNQVVYEHRVGPRGQYELIVPFEVQRRESGGSEHGLGDIGLAFKHALFDNRRAGTIVSAGTELTLPTGKEASGLGGGISVMEMFGAYGQILPRDGFLHLQGGVELPVTKRAGHADEAFFRVAVGKTYSQNRWDRAWSPMVEVLGSRELGSDESSRWDLVPELQVTLSRRQHIMISGGVRIPVNDRDGRKMSILTYFLWDWFDGGLFDGWKAQP
jgi:mono/diheme cytochrome c family protein